MERIAVYLSVAEEQDSPEGLPKNHSHPHNMRTILTCTGTTVLKWRNHTFTDLVLPIIDPKICRSDVVILKIIDDCLDGAF